ncbi:ABC transporter ATP-binding protein [Leptolyngbya sp. AN03gr2]|uniref:ABC transporter ATP-binding protein n=1 Tax=unclassified Leptolyngbya TaxID=2650499 RepID=UPI003D315A1E
MTTNRASIWFLLWQMITYARSLYWTDTALWILIAGLPAVPGVIIREFFNTLTQHSAFPFSSWTWIVILLATGLAQIAAIFTGRITKTQHRFTMNALIQRNLLAKVLEHPGAEALTTQDNTISPGEVISFFREDATQIEDTVVGTNEVLGEGIFAIGSLILLLSVNASITLFVFLPLVLIAVILHRMSDRIKRYRRASRQATQQVTGMVGEMFTAVQAIQVAGAENSMLSHFRQLCDRRRQSIVKDQLLNSILSSSFDNLVSLGTGAILFFAAQSMQNSQTLSVGDFALFVYYLAYVTYFLGFFGEFIALSKQSEVSFERMQALVNSEADTIVAHHPLYFPTLTRKKSQLSMIQEVIRDRLEELQAFKLNYHYPGSDRGITDISLHLQRGSFTVITGSIGSGKTTLLQVLLGLLPMQSGEIFWNSQKIANPAQFFVPPQSAYTPQVPQLFSTTLRENILLGLRRSDEEVQNAIELAMFDRDLAMMPDGLDTQIGSRGMRLSGGQIQRVAAARMLIRQPELLVFDDLSSALDVETEQRLWSKLFQLSSQTWTPTFLVVSHRRAVLQRADRILLLNNGRIELEGAFADLPEAYKR